MMAGDTVNELDISETGGRLQAWLGKTVWISVHAGEARPLLTADGELAYERGYLDIEQQAAREFGGKLEGVFAFHVGPMRLYITPENFRGASGREHEVRIRLDGAEVRIRDEFWGAFDREGTD